MKLTQLLLLSSVAIPTLFGSAHVALAEARQPEARIVVAQAAEDRVQRARELLEQAQQSLQQAEETGGDVRAARRGVSEAMQNLRAAEDNSGAPPAQSAKPAAPTAPKAGPTDSRPARSPAEDGVQPKPYQPPAGAKKPDDAKPTPERKPSPSEAPKAQPAKPQPPKSEAPKTEPAKPQPPKAQPAPERRPAETGARPPRGEQARPDGSRPRPDARPPRPDNPDGRYRDYRDAPPQRDIYIEGPGFGDREVPPPPGYRDGRPYRPNGRFIDGGRATERQIEDTFRAAPVQRIDRGYSMNEIRRDPRVRDMVRRVDIDTITFEFGSARVPDDQVRKLRAIGRAIGRVVDRDPYAVFLIEGHTDAVGTDLANLELSDRRAAAVAGILADYFDIPRDALVSQGYGERYLKIPTEAPERQNRRVTIRNIGPLLQGR
ncbi:OmpA family protein [Kaistia adipata]|uniref:OmpA family protein n=1 Tax=Kaistia adipata TaxID=166954 RepID=UPI000419B1C3|nr:OmpA family protein [Kaistia adipata]